MLKSKQIDAQYPQVQKKQKLDHVPPAESLVADPAPLILQHLQIIRTAMQGRRKPNYATATTHLNILAQNYGHLLSDENRKALLEVYQAAIPELFAADDHLESVSLKRLFQQAYKKIWTYPEFKKLADDMALSSQYTRIGNILKIKMFAFKDPFNDQTNPKHRTLSTEVDDFKEIVNSLFIAPFENQINQQLLEGRVLRDHYIQLSDMALKRIARGQDDYKLLNDLQIIARMLICEKENPFYNAHYYFVEALLIERKAGNKMLACLDALTEQMEKFTSTYIPMNGLENKQNNPIVPQQYFTRTALSRANRVVNSLKQRTFFGLNVLVDKGLQLYNMQFSNASLFDLSAKDKLLFDAWLDEYCNKYNSQNMEKDVFYAAHQLFVEALSYEEQSIEHYFRCLTLLKEQIVFDGFWDDERFKKLPDHISYDEHKEFAARKIHEIITYLTPIISSGSDAAKARLARFKQSLKNTLTFGHIDYDRRTFNDWIYIDYRKYHDKDWGFFMLSIDAINMDKISLDEMGFLIGIAFDRTIDARYRNVIFEKIQPAQLPRDNDSSAFGEIPPKRWERIYQKFLKLKAACNTDADKILMIQFIIKKITLDKNSPKEDYYRRLIDLYYELFQLHKKNPLVVFQLQPCIDNVNALIVFYKKNNFDTLCKPEIMRDLLRLKNLMDPSPVRRVLLPILSSQLSGAPRSVSHTQHQVMNPGGIVSSSLSVGP